MPLLGTLNFAFGLPKSDLR